MGQYRKKPVVISAYKTDMPIKIDTLEGVMQANAGDWIITGVKGEKYPCKPDIFEATYEALSGTKEPLDLGGELRTIMMKLMELVVYTDLSGEQELSISSAVKCVLKEHGEEYRL